MKLGVFDISCPPELSLEEMLDFVQSQGIETIEFGTGNYSGDRFVKPEEMLANPAKGKAFLHAVESRGLTISALDCHGNPFQPNQRMAQKHHETFIRTIDLAHAWGISVVVGLSGTPGTPDGSRYPNLPSYPWPIEYQEIFHWQWEQQLIPYWREVGRYAAERGVRIAIEPHGGFSVHSPATLLKLRNAVGDVIGTNLDPSHLWWQGIDPIAAIKILGGQQAIYHLHAKDTYIDQDKVNLYGLIDMYPLADVKERSWIFRTVGYGHDLLTWAGIMSALQFVGYDDAIGIEQEDPLIHWVEGVTKAAYNLRTVIIQTPKQK